MNSLSQLFPEVSPWGQRIPPTLCDLIKIGNEVASSCLKMTQKSSSRLDAVYISVSCPSISQDRVFENRAFASTTCTFFEILGKQQFPKIEFSPRRHAYFCITSFFLSRQAFLPIELSPRRRAHLEYSENPTFRNSSSRLDGVHMFF
jgi:hypothetical protein